MNRNPSPFDALNNVVTSVAETLSWPLRSVLAAVAGEEPPLAPGSRPLRPAPRPPQEERREEPRAEQPRELPREEQREAEPRMQGDPRPKARSVRLKISARRGVM